MSTSLAASVRGAAEPSAALSAPAMLAEEHWPFYGEDEIEAAAALLRAGKVNQWTSDAVFAFEQALAARFGGGQGIALANGSVALELPLRAFGIGPGDEVVVAPRTFVASAFCAQLVGATPVFADVCPDSGNITAATIAEVLTERTAAIIPVHLGGWPADMEAIMEVAKSRGLVVIEDCAQAHGAESGGRSVGTFGDAAAFSFCQDKIISTAGEGGFTSFRDRERWEWAWSFKDHGKSWSKMNEPPREPGFRWVHDRIGTNWRMTAPQAAIGLRQLAKLDAWHGARTRNAHIWADALSIVDGLRIPLPPEGTVHAFYKLHFYVEAGPDTERLRDEILRRAATCGLRLFSGSCSEVYRERAFDDLAVVPLPNARALGEASLMVEVHPTLRPDLLAARAETLAKIARNVLG